MDENNYCMGRKNKNESVGKEESGFDEREIYKKSISSCQSRWKNVNVYQRGTIFRMREQMSFSMHVKGLHGRVVNELNRLRRVITRK